MHSTQGSEENGSEFVSVWAVVTTLLHLAGWGYKMPLNIRYILISEIKKFIEIWATEWMKWHNKFEICLWIWNPWVRSWLVIQIWQSSVDWGIENLSTRWDPEKWTDTENTWGPSPWHPSIQRSDKGAVRKRDRRGIVSEVGRKPGEGDAREAKRKILKRKERVNSVECSWEVD